MAMLTLFTYILFLKQLPPDKSTSQLYTAEGMTCGAPLEQHKIWQMTTY